MTAPSQKHGVIRRDAVRMMKQPAMVDCSPAGDGQAVRPMTVVPLLDGDRIMGFEIRCGCGSSAVVECIYAKEA